MSFNPHRSRKRHAGASATLVTLSLAICLGAAAETTAAAMPRAAEPASRAGLTADQRQALASLLAQLTDAARDLHRTPDQTQTAAVQPRSVTVDMPVRQPTSGTRERTHALASPPLRPGLLNLPPPFDC